MNSKPSKPLFVKVHETGSDADIEAVRQSLRQTLRQERYTVKEAARVLGCHEKTVRGWMKEGKLGSYRPTERKTYIIRDQLARFLSRRETKLPLWQ